MIVRAANSPLLGLPKGPTRHQEQRKKLSRMRAVIRQTHDKVFADSQVCAVCGDTEAQSHAKGYPSRHEMHEDPPRCETRGLPPEQRFNTAISMRICPTCHRGYGHKVQCQALTERGWAGDYDVQQQNAASGAWETIRRIRRSGHGEHCVLGKALSLPH